MNNRRAELLFQFVRDMDVRAKTARKRPFRNRSLNARTGRTKIRAASVDSTYLRPAVYKANSQEGGRRIFLSTRDATACRGVKARCHDWVMLRTWKGVRSNSTIPPLSLRRIAAIRRVVVGGVARHAFIHRIARHRCITRFNRAHRTVVVHRAVQHIVRGLVVIF